MASIKVHATFFPALSYIHTMIYEIEQKKQKKAKKKKMKKKMKKVRIRRINKNVSDIMQQLNE